MSEEQPLIYSKGQGYLSYHKGVVAMYALQDYIGEGAVNTALKGLVRNFGFKQAPYPDMPRFNSNIQIDFT